jgi:hypothetical protein
MGITAAFLLGPEGCENTSPALNSHRRRRRAVNFASFVLAMAPVFCFWTTGRLVQAGLEERGNEGAAPDMTEASTSRPESPRIASRATGVATSAGSPTGLNHPVALAKQAIADCQAKYSLVHDYTCTLLKRERINGALTTQHVMSMKARANPVSIYLRFQRPNKGREAIYVAGRNKGKLVAHDVGFGKLLAGTLYLDPLGSMAMEECRHPVTEAGIGWLIEQVAKHWKAELTPEESQITFNSNMRIGSHACTMIESVHPVRQSHFLYHTVRLYVDQEHGLPIRFEAYDWPKKPGATGELVEEYTYLDLKLNVGLSDHDFDPHNKAYAFGRF